MPRATWAQLRSRTEPLVEIIQAKGESECHTGVGTEDELCLYEKLERRRICGGSPDDASCARVCADDSSPEGCVAPNNYVRNALKAGLEFDRQLGVNPYRLGFIGSTDTHNGTPGGTDESDYQGHHGFEDGTPARRARSGPRSRNFQPAGRKAPAGWPASGRKRIPAPPSLPRCNAVKPSPPAARASPCVFLPAGIFPRLST